jgi:hypothetical protein
MKSTRTQTKHKRIDELTSRELDMVYSLVRIGNWSDSDIARRYKIPESEVRKVSENYVELRKLSECCAHQVLPSNKPRKRRSDARYATSSARQAAYRARLRERRRADMQLPLPPSRVDSTTPVDTVTA